MIAENYDQKPIRDLQNMLRTISHFTKEIPCIIPDGIFGENTKKCVLDFQTAYGLERSGEVNRNTWDKIREVFIKISDIYSVPQKCMVLAGRNISINKDDEIPELLVIQSMIHALSKIFANIPAVDISGIHDKKSVAAVAFIQGVSGIEPTGVINTGTYNAISNVYTSNVAKSMDF